jgi:hypothetical protein
MDALKTDEKGHIAFLKVQLEARKKGAIVLLPTTPERFDLVLLYQGMFYRAQVKFANGKSQHSAGAVSLHLRRRKRVYVADEVDVLLVYLPQIDKVCWFGPEVFNGKATLYLRLHPARNGQRNGCRMVDDYIW